MTPKLHIVFHGSTLWKNELPVDFAGSRLPGGRVFTATADIGSICIQLYNGRNFSFGYTVINSKQPFTVQIRSYNGGLWLVCALLGDGVFMNKGGNLQLPQGQWALFRGIPEVNINFKEDAYYQLFSVWFSSEFYKELLSYFPMLDKELLNMHAGNLVSDGNINMDHAIRELIAQVLRCKYPPQWRPPFYRYRAEDILFKYLVDKSVLDPHNAAYTKAEQDKIYVAEQIITEDISAHFIIPELAKKVGMNEYRFKAVFKMIFGMGAYEYLRERRLQKAIELLDRGEPVKYAAIETGWRPEDLINAYKARFGITPGSKRMRK